MFRTRVKKSNFPDDFFKVHPLLDKKMSNEALRSFNRYPKKIEFIQGKITFENIGKTS